MKKLRFFTLSDHDNQIADDLDDTIIVPTDWASANYLDSKNVSYVLAENYVSRSEYVQLDRVSETIATRWWRNEHFKSLQYRGISLGYLLEWEFHITLAKFLKQLADLNTIVTQEKPDVIIGSSGNDMFTQIQQFVADKYGIEFRSIGSGEPIKSFHMDVIPITFKIGPMPVTIHLNQSQFKRTTGIMNKLTRLLKIFGGRSGGSKLLLLDFNIVQYSAMLEGFEKHGIEVFLLNKRRPLVWNMDSLKIELKRRYNFASLREYADSDSRANVRSATSEINDAIDRIWEGGGFEREFSLDGLNFWPSMSNDFREFCKSRMSQGIEDIEYGNNFFDRNRLDMTLVWGYVLPFEKVMLQLGKVRGIPSLAIQHGVLTDLRDKNGNWTFLESRHSDADIIAAWGKASSNWFVKNGIPKERVIDLGSPRYDALFAAKSRGQSNTNNILLATSGLPTSFAAYNTVSTAKRYEEFIRKTCLAIKKLPDKKLIVKLHPFADETIDVISVVRESYPEARIAKNENIVDLINHSDLLISTYTYSSVVLESMILRKPAMIFETLNHMLEPEELPYSKSGASIRIKEPEDIEDALQKFFSDPQQRIELERTSQLFVSNFLSSPGQSIETLSNYISNMIDS